MHPRHIKTGSDPNDPHTCLFSIINDDDEAKHSITTSFAVVLPTLWHFFLFHFISLESNINNNNMSLVNVIHMVSKNETGLLFSIIARKMMMNENVVCISFAFLLSHHSLSLITLTLITLSPHSTKASIRTILSLHFFHFL
jgi:hypothetical protein